MIRALKDNEKYTSDSNIIQQWIVKILKKNVHLQKILINEPDAMKYLTEVATKKLPTE